MAFPKCASYFANRHKGMQILFVVIVTVTAVLFLQQVVPFVLGWTLNIKPVAPEMRYITKGARNYDNNNNNNNNNNRYSPGENSNSENNKNNNNNDNNNNIEIKSDSYIASAHLQQQDQGIIQPLSQPFSNTNGPATMSSLQKSKQTQDDPNAGIIATIPKSVLRQDSNRLFPAGQPADVNGRPSPQNQKEMMIDNEEKSGPPPQPSNSNTSKQKAAATLLNRSEQTESSDPLPVACQFPDLDPHDPIMMYHIKPYPNIDCSGALPNLVYRDGDTLRINTQKARDLGVVVDYCHYESITMTGYSDFAVRHNFTSKPFQDWITIPLNHEHLIVSCFRQSKKIAESFFAIIREKPAAEKELEQNLKRHIEKNAPRETLSVLLIGIDGTSRQNSIRLMPKMRKYVLEKMNAIEMYKFTKVGDNTFPNALGILSGKSLTDIGRRWNKRMPLDSIDDVMLWHEYRNAGYRTAMLLDSIRLTAFHFEKEGWKHPPWDYYYRPLVIATSKRENFFCMGDEPEVTFHSKYWHQLTSLYNNTKSKPYFAYAFNMRITHDIPHRATMADGLYEQFFQELVQRNVLNNTVVVLFSDHGTRTSPLRGNHIGMLETRMPFLFFMFPPWFHTKYPDLIKTMRTNQHRLTSMFDVHATLKDILNFQGQTGKGTLQQREISLFKEIPRERQCSHAGIPMEFCACTQISRVPVSEDEKKAISNALAYHIKTLTRSNNYNNRDNVCTPLEMAEVKSIVKIHGDCRCKECNYYGVVVRMEPGGGVFEATVMDDVRIRVKKVIGVVIRLNSYQSGEAECMKDETFKPFCFCKKKW